MSVGSNALGRIFPIVDSRPKKCGMPTLLPVVRDVLVAFEVLAESSISISTVTMSPTRLARWSLKKVRAPACHSELAEPGWGEGSRDIDIEARAGFCCAR